MAGTNQFKVQIDYILAADPRKDDHAITDVLNGISVVTAKMPDMGAKVAERIIAARRSGLYFDHHNALYGLVMRGWAETQDEELELRMAKLIHSSYPHEGLYKQISERFSAFLKHHEEWSHAGAFAARTVATVQYSDKLRRFIVSAGDQTASPSVKAAANAYLRLASPWAIRELFVPR